MRKLFVGLLSIGFYIGFLALILLAKDFPCIPSTVVEKFDVISIGEKHTVYSCKSRRPVPFSTVVQSVLQKILPRLNQLELVLQKIDTAPNSVKVTIDQIDRLHYSFRGNEIRLGQELATNTGHLEHAIIRTWLKKYSDQESAQLNLFDESIADLIYYATFGRIDYVDPITQLTPEVGHAKWPQVLQNLDVYCESAWKSSADYQRCASLEHVNLERKQLLTMSLRPLLTASLIAAFDSLSYHEQNNFLHEIPQLISRRTIDSENAIAFLLNQDNSLQEGLSILRLFADQFELKQDVSYPQRRFIARLNQYLQSKGVTDSFAEAYFDIIVEFPDNLSPSSPLFKSLELASKQNLNLQIAVKDKNQIWILPSRSGLSLNIFNQVKARQHVFFACPILKDIAIGEFIKVSEKLLLIKGCDSQKSYAFDMLLKFGVPDFIKTESQLAFIQFHLPSLEQKLNDLEHIKNFFELVQNRDVTQREFQLLGWQDVQWNDKFHFYKPKAAIDAIEFFRVETPPQSN